MACTISKQLAPMKGLGIALIMAMQILVMSVSLSHAHGGKKHGDNDFTALQAIQKAITAYDNLIVAGKLEESWETGLRNIEVITREKDNRKEYRVSFERTDGAPNTVYIFYNENGDYSGSNFDGN